MNYYFKYVHFSGLLLYVGVGIALREDVRMFLAEYMADPATGDDLQASSTHPYSKRNLYKHNTINSNQCAIQYFNSIMAYTSKSF